MELTNRLTMAWKVLTTKEQPLQSTTLVAVVVEAKTVLVPSVGKRKTGWTVVHSDCADAGNALL